MGSSRTVAAFRSLHFKAVSLTRLRPVLQQFSFRPSGNSATKIARLGRCALRAVASKEEEPSGQESANRSGAGSKQFIGRIPKVDVKPEDDAESGRQVKICTKCQYPKLLVDFKESRDSVDKRQEVCRACMATTLAMWNRKELYHLSLTPEEAWQKAKTCSKCSVRKEIRDFRRSPGTKDGTCTQCRSCGSIYDKARPAKKRVDTPRRCNICLKLKPARAFSANSHSLDGLCHHCKDCHNKFQNERNARLRDLPLELPERQMKVCTKCGKVRKTADFSKDSQSRDGLNSLCRPCIRARDQARREREAIKASPPAESTKHDSV
jgi:hypothetical protein